MLTPLQRATLCRSLVPLACQRTVCRFILSRTTEANQPGTAASSIDAMPTQARVKTTTTMVILSEILAHIPCLSTLVIIHQRWEWEQMDILFMDDTQQLTRQVFLLILIHAMVTLMGHWDIITTLTKFKSQVEVIAGQNIVSVPPNVGQATSTRSQTFGEMRIPRPKLLTIRPRQIQNTVHSKEVIMRDSDHAVARLSFGLQMVSL